MGVIPTDTTRDIGRIGRLIADLNERLDQVAPVLGALARGVINSAGLSITNGGTLSVSGGGRIVLYGAGKIGTMVAGAFGMATDDGLGNLTFPKTQMTTGGFLADSGSNGYVIMGVDSATGDAVISVSGSGRMLHVPYITTSSAANTRMELDGTLRLVSSSMRFKQDVKDAEIDSAAVLEMVGRTWRDRSDVAADSGTTKRYVGFIAEELHDLGLTDFVEYEDGQPYAIAYDRLSVALLAVMKDQDARLKVLEAS